MCGHTDPHFQTACGKSILEVTDTGTQVLDNTRPFLRSSIVSFWIIPACSKERKHHTFRQYWYTINVPVFTNTGTFQYLGPEVYFFPACHWMTPFLFFTFCSHLMTPIFKMLSHLMTFLRNIYRWNWASCSHWMTPIFPNKWPPRIYPIFVWKEGFM